MRHPWQWEPCLAFPTGNASLLPGHALPCSSLAHCASTIHAPDHPRPVDVVDKCHGASPPATASSGAAAAGGIAAGGSPTVIGVTSPTAGANVTAPAGDAGAAVLKPANVTLRVIERTS